MLPSVMDLINADCMDILPKLATNSIDLILTDPPYGNTYCKWDVIIPIDPMWRELKRVIKPTGTICIFGTEPFSSLLRYGNLPMYKYDWIWEKNKAANFGASKYQPLNYFEYISVFYKQCTYYPQMTKRVGRIRDRRKDSSIGKNTDPGAASTAKAMNHGYSNNYDPTLAYPKRLLRYNIENTHHETQKPVALLEYLIKTYTLGDGIILDFAMGSGSTGVACKNLGCPFIGIEKDLQIYQIATKRIYT